MHKALYKSVLFKEIPESDAERIFDNLNGQIRTYQKGEIVVLAESLFDEIGILLEGKLCKTQYYVDGTEQVIEILNESYMVGLEVALSGKKTSFYQIYATKPSKVYFFKVHYLEQEGWLDDKDRIFLYKRCTRFLTGEDVRKYRKIEILSTKSAREKILIFLNNTSRGCKRMEFDINLNREQLAAFLGLNRSVLSHELKKMEKEGFLKVRKNHFILYRLK